MTHPRVAVIVVHGVADQQPGETARSVVDLLVASAPDGTCYTSASTEDLTLRVAPLPPQPEARPLAAPATADAAAATPKGEDRPFMKSLRQSLRSDFQSEGWAAAPPPRDEMPRDDVDPADIAAPPTNADRGIAVTNYLLAKHVRNGATPESYETTCISLQRHGVGPDQVGTPADVDVAQVDVHEMYWADLSRLSGSMPRIVSELFTLVFRLSKLGRETVDEMWGELGRARDPHARWGSLFAGAWNTVAWLQIGLDWLFVNGLALLFTQLALLGVLLVGLGFTSGIAPGATDASLALHQTWLHHGMAIALSVMGVLRMIYRRGDGQWLQFAAPLVIIVVCLYALVFAPSLLQWITALTMLAVITFANEAALRIADDRFPLVHVVGRWMWIASALVMFGSAVHETQVQAAPAWRDVWVHAALFTTEAVLLVVKWWWILVGPLLVVWFVAGEIARAESGYASRASIATGRLGITVSFGMFLAVTMTVWALVGNVLDASVQGAGYRPCIFAMEPAASAVAPAAGAGENACMWTSMNAKRAAPTQPMPSAKAVLDDRYVKSTSAFSLLATLLLMLVAYLLTMFAPSVAAELKLIADSQRDAHQQELDKRDAALPDRAVATLLRRSQHARALGRWLTAGYRRLDLAVAFISLLGVTLSLGIAVLFLSTVFEHDGVTRCLDAMGLTSVVAWLTGLEQGVSGASQTLFTPLQAAVFSAAGIGAALSALGGLLSRRIPPLRAPLDAAMDVDNHFREFPRTAIPRAHIFSRYAAVLEHIQGKGYDRIVVVSHSQGTVISSELLRFLSSRAQRAPTPDDAPLLAGQPLPPLSLLTLGCPLRQLYGARFPGLYAWTLAKNGDVFGPRATDIGVQRWMNAFCSGDYVGRWLWSNAADEPTLQHPTEYAVGHDPFGRVDMYGGFDPMPPAEAAVRPAREVEVCLGLGAHTHYFERDQTTVAWMIDYLIHAQSPGGAATPAAAPAPGPVPTLAAGDGQAPQVVAAQASVASDGVAAPAAAPDETAPPPAS